MRDVSVRRICEAEWPALRDVRLRALADRPDAFGSTLARESGFAETDWQEWARDGSWGASETCVLAWADDEPVGIVGAFAEDGRDHVHLIAMWVAPAWRQSGVGRALVTAICSWATESGFPAVRLDVESGNADARRLYERAGFTPTGRSRPYRERPHLTQVELELPLQ